MKKRAFLVMFFGLSFFLFKVELIAQKNADPTVSAVVLDDKAQKKVDQARVDLAKNKQKLNKEIVSYEKAKTKHDKDLKQGKLSPTDKEKGEKKLTKKNQSIGKLKKKIADGEAFLSQVQSIACSFHDACKRIANRKSYVAYFHTWPYGLLQDIRSGGCFPQEEPVYRTIQLAPPHLFHLIS